MKRVFAVIADMGVINMLTGFLFGLAAVALLVAVWVALP